MWRDNTYPGAACDVPSPLYSWSWAINPTWGRRYSPQPEILDYLRGSADREGLLALVRTNQEVATCDLDEPAGTWRVTTTDGTTYDADVVVSAVGQLSNPVIPDLPGTDSFAGPAFHSAEWRHDVRLAGKRVAVVGTGASAIQFVPGIVDEVGAHDGVPTLGAVRRRQARPGVPPAPPPGLRPLPLAAHRRTPLRLLAHRTDERRDHRRDDRVARVHGDDPGVLAAPAAAPGQGRGAAPQAGAGLPDRLQAGAVLQRLVPRPRP